MDSREHHEGLARHFEANAARKMAQWRATGQVAFKMDAEWHQRTADKHWAAIGGKPVAVIDEVGPAPRQRCPHYATIREFFGVAREAGLDTSKAAQDRCRGAVGMLLGRPVASRGELSGAEWGFCTNAVRMGRLFW